MILTGSPTDLNTALTLADNFTYSPDTDFNGTDTLSILVSDLGNYPDPSDPENTALTAEASATITVNAVNDTPTITVTAAQTVNEDMDLTISGISVADVDDDLDADEVRQVSLNVSDGTITLGDATGVAFTAGGDGQAFMTFTGTLTDLNAALDDMIYRGGSRLPRFRHTHGDD